MSRFVLRCFVRLMTAGAKLSFKRERDRAVEREREREREGGRGERAVLGNNVHTGRRINLIQSVSI